MSKVTAVVWMTARHEHSRYPVYLHEVLFKPLLRWVTDALAAVGVSKVCFVRKDDTFDELTAQSVEPHLSDITFLDAASDGLKQDMLHFVKETDGHALMLTGPMLVTPHALDGLIDAHANADNLLTELLTDDEWPTGLYCFATSAADEVFGALDGDFDFKSTCAELHQKGVSLGEFFVSDGRGGAARAETPHDLHMVRRALQTAAIDRHISQGVTVLDPIGTFIGPDVILGHDCTILPGVMLSGETVIGDDCVIGPYTVMENVIAGDRCVIKMSHLVECQLGDDVTMGPYVNVRPDSVLSDGVTVGDFVEIKNSVVGKKTKLPHLSYIGDTDMGAGVNVGCGSVTVNYDGKTKARCVVEDNCFIGCNTNLIAPVRVGEGAYTAAGSTITDDVPAEALGIARARQVNKEEWAKKRRAEDDVTFSAPRK